MVSRQRISEAETYIQLFSREHGMLSHFPDRAAQVRAEIEQTGGYRQTLEELIYGAKVAWRNSTRCIGRLPWFSLTVRDMRHLTSAQELFQALVEHLRFATNGGKIRTVMTVFAPQAPEQPGIRIWNPQLVRYAGYRQPDGSIIGDPLQVDLTDALLRLGWTGGEGTPFDILPLVIHMPGQPPTLFELPQDAILEVPLYHPDYPWFGDLRLKWHALPTISNMRVEIGGISYTAAPFNGYYMGTEIGRNLGDANRYNVLPVIAARMGLDTTMNRSLWKDAALVVLNQAILFSFHKQGITIVDHHTASNQFVCHQRREEQAGRTTYGDWGWLVPPVSGSLSPLFHRPYENRVMKPNIFYQSTPFGKGMTTIQVEDGWIVQEKEYNNVVCEVIVALQEQLTPSVWEYLPPDAKDALIQHDMEKGGYRWQ